MSRPPLEVADIVRAAGEAFIERHRHWLRWKHVKVLRAIARCRTAALGGHLDECMRCGHRAPISYNSCRDRHCPKCQTAARDRWIAARQKELLPTRYLHVVFTLPGRLAPLVLQNKKVSMIFYFAPVRKPFSKLLAIPRHLGAEIGFFSVLHTWSQKLTAIHMCTVSCRPAASRLIAPVGFALATTTSFPRKCWVNSSAASSSTHSKRLFKMANCTSMET